MQSALNARLKRLEALARATPTVVAPVLDEKAFRHLREKFARIKEEAKAGTDPDPQVRLAYWRRIFVEQQATVASGGKSAEQSPPHPTVINPEGMAVIRLKHAQTCLPDTHWHLLEAQGDPGARWTSHACAVRCG